MTMQSQSTSAERANDVVVRRFLGHEGRLGEHFKNPDAPSRQAYRAQVRAQWKAETRPGPRKAPSQTRAQINALPGGPGSFERHVKTLTKPQARLEITYHFTKGYRSRVVAN